MKSLITQVAFRLLTALLVLFLLGELEIPFQVKLARYELTTISTVPSSHCGDYTLHSKVIIIVVVTTTIIIVITTIFEQSLCVRHYASSLHTLPHFPLVTTS